MEGLSSIPQEGRNFSHKQEAGDEVVNAPLAEEAKKYTTEMMGEKAEFIHAISELEQAAQAINQEAAKVDQKIRQLLDKQPVMDSITKEALVPLEAQRSDLSEKLIKVKDMILELEADVIQFGKQIEQSGGPQMS